MRRSITALFGAALAAVTTFASQPVTAAPAARHTFLSPAQRGLARDAIRVGSDVRDLGRLSPSAPVSIGLMMHYRHENELQALTLAQGDRRSPYYHKYLSVAQWNNYFAPDPATYARAATALRRAGFRIQQTFANRGMIRALAPATVAERYFHTQLHRVSQARRGQRYLNVTTAVMPAELRDSVISVAGLQSVVGVHFPIRFADKGLAHHPAMRRAQLLQRQLRAQAASRIVYATAAPASPSPKPLTTSTPVAGPDPTESPGDPTTEFGLNMDLGYGPPTFADAYDYPVQHGYSGKGHAAGSVIDSDFSDHDAALEFSTFGITHTGKSVRVCTDPNGVCTICQDTATTVSANTASCDPEGESTLDAQAIMTLAPGADFYEYLTNENDSLDDLDVDAAYERVVSDNIVEAVNSSFGECETDDPSALYDENYIAMEGAAQGIMFSASSGDTGGTSCGTYAGNGTPQTEINASEPASAPYFVAVGGTSFLDLVTCSGPGTGMTCYTNERAWINGGGGVSVYEPQPSWQTALVAAGTTAGVKGTAVPAAASGRDVPDLAFTADPEGGVPLAVTYQATTEGIGGTSLSSPMWVAMQTSIDAVQNSRNGFVSPRLYAIADSGTSTATDGTYYSFAFRDILLGSNVPFLAGPGYDLTTGIGSVLGWELAGTE